jgi:plastocyanin
MKATFAAVLFAVAVVVAPVAAVVAAAAAAPATTQPISIFNFAYTPSPVTVAHGTLVTWTNNDGFGHSVTSDPTDTTDPFDSSPANCSPTVSTGCIPASGTFSHTFGVVGTFAYHCRVHSFMHGTITVSAAAVTVTATSPTALGQGAAKSVTFTGTGFTSGATVSLSGTGVTAGPTTFVSSTSVKAMVKVAATAATGTRDVTVTDPAGGGSGTCTGCLTIDAGPVPTSASPNTLARGATNKTVLLSGAGFVTHSKAKFKGTGVTISQTAFVSSTQLRLTVTVASNAPTGARTVTVSNPDGGRASKTNVLTIT